MIWLQFLYRCPLPILMDSFNKIKVTHIPPYWMGEVNLGSVPRPWHFLVFSLSPLLSSARSSPPRCTHTPFRSRNLSLKCASSRKMRIIHCHVLVKSQCSAQRVWVCRDFSLQVISVLMGHKNCYRSVQFSFIPSRPVYRGTALDWALC